MYISIVLYLSNLFLSDLEYALRKINESDVGLKFNGKHLLLAYAHEVNIMEDNICKWNINFNVCL
jgi:hypothetical protein